MTTDTDADAARDASSSPRRRSLIYCGLFQALAACPLHLVLDSSPGASSSSSCESVLAGDGGGHGSVGWAAFPEPRPQRRLPCGEEGGGAGDVQGARGGELLAREERSRGGGAGGGAPASERGEQEAERDAPRGGGQVHRAAEPGQRHGGGGGEPPVVDVGRRLGVAVQEADPQRQPRHRRRRRQPAAVRRGRQLRRRPRPDGVHVGRCRRRSRAVQAHPRGVQAQGLQARRPRRPLRPQPRGEGRVPMAEVRAEGDQGQPVPESLLPVLVRAGVPREEEGAAQRGGQHHTGGDVRGRAQPRPAAAARRQERRRRRREAFAASAGEQRPRPGASRPWPAAAAAERGGRVVGGGGEEELRGADGGDADEGPGVQGGARQRALRTDPRAIAVQEQLTDRSQLLLVTSSSISILC